MYNINSKHQKPIGIVDSGSGGLYIMQHVCKLLPQYDYLYLGDHKHTPYGSKSFDAIYKYTLACIENLSEKNCPLIIIACNTACAKALRNIQQLWLPKQQNVKRVLGIIIPTAEEIINHTQTKHLGILATAATVSSNTFPVEIKKLFSDITVYQHACLNWVNIIEQYYTYDEDYIEAEIKKDIEILLSKSPSIDCLILGCTHYPLLMDKLKKYIPPHIDILNQGEIVANKIQIYLERHPEIENLCSKNATVKYLTSGNPEFIEKSTRALFKQDIKFQNVILG